MTMNSLAKTLAVALLFTLTQACSTHEAKPEAPAAAPAPQVEAPAPAPAPAPVVAPKDKCALHAMTPEMKAMHANMCAQGKTHECCAEMAKTEKCPHMAKTGKAKKKGKAAKK